MSSHAVSDLDRSVYLLKVVGVVSVPHDQVEETRTTLGGLFGRVFRTRPTYGFEGRTTLEPVDPPIGDFRAEEVRVIVQKVAAEIASMRCDFYPGKA